MKSLVGYTGFVGSNINKNGFFDNCYNSKNIHDAYNTKPDLLVYAGIPAQKFLANKFPEKDLEFIKQAIENIKLINPKKIVLISTIDVYETPINVTEDDEPINNNEPYGKNRSNLEQWVKNYFHDYLIIRLPALYGINIKKNFIYDMIYLIPSMLKEEKYNELKIKAKELENYYTNLNNGFYKLNELTHDDEKKLKEIYKKLGFSALNFTDCRGTFQFYNLDYLWKHINTAMKNDIKVLNIATEPVQVSEIYQYVTSENFENESNGKIPYYNFKTKYSDVFGGHNGYIFDKSFVLSDIKKFIKYYGKVKLSVSNLAWGAENDSIMLDYLSKNEFQGLEIAPTRLIPNNPYDHVSEAKKIAKMIQANYHLVISSMQSIWYGRKENIFNSEEERKILINYTKKAIDFAQAINCKNIVFGCPKNRNIINYDKDIKDIAIKFFEDIGLYASEHSVIIAIEPNPTIYNTNFINTTEEAINFVKMINMDSIKVNLDIGTMISNKESIDILKGNMKYINHIHISEPLLKKIEQRNLHNELIDVITNSKYQNFISIEMGKSELNDVKETSQYVRRLFK